MKKRQYHRQHTIAGVFRRYVGLFFFFTLLTVFLLFFLFFLMVGIGWVLPADYMESELRHRTDEIKEAEEVTEELLPEGSQYGVYDEEGAYRYGTFTEPGSKKAWSYYEDDNIYSGDGGYYRFIVRKNKEVCIVRYEIGTRFNVGPLSEKLPSPELMLPAAGIVLLIIQMIVLSGYFGKYMKRRLNVLESVTRKIQDQDLDFAREHSDLKEVDEVLDSLYRMKNALVESLEQQWDMEQRRNEQIAALAHDIKTPLTVIKGNAELIREGDLPVREAEYNDYVLRSAAAIEEYLTMLNEIVAETAGVSKEAGGTAPVRDGEAWSTYSCQQLVDRLEEQARGQILGCRLQMETCREAVYGSVTCSLNQIIRAWGNVIGNAVDHTASGKCIKIHSAVVSQQDGTYLAVSAIDEGTGFSEQDLKHATEQFYQGDKSRHDKLHHGLGLHTASVYVRAQGGRLSLENTKEHGAKVTLYLRVSPDT